MSIKPSFYSFFPKEFIDQKTRTKDVYQQSTAGAHAVAVMMNHLPSCVFAHMEKQYRIGNATWLQLLPENLRKTVKRGLSKKRAEEDKIRYIQGVFKRVFPDFIKNTEESDGNRKIFQLHFLPLCTKEEQETFLDELHEKERKKCRFVQDFPHIPPEAKRVYQNASKALIREVKKHLEKTSRLVQALRKDRHYRQITYPQNVRFLRWLGPFIKPIYNSCYPNKFPFRILQGFVKKLFFSKETEQEKIQNTLLFLLPFWYGKKPWTFDIHTIFATRDFSIDPFVFFVEKIIEKKYENPEKIVEKNPTVLDKLSFLQRSFHLELYAALRMKEYSFDVQSVYKIFAHCLAEYGPKTPSSIDKTELFFNRSLIEKSIYPFFLEKVQIALQDLLSPPNQPKKAHFSDLDQLHLQQKKIDEALYAKISKNIPIELAALNDLLSSPAKGAALYMAGYILYHSFRKKSFWKVYFSAVKKIEKQQMDALPRFYTQIVRGKNPTRIKALYHKKNPLFFCALFSFNKVCSVF